MIPVLTVEKAEARINLLKDRLVEACAVWTALYDTGAPGADTRWKWAQNTFMSISHEIHALKVMIANDGKQVRE